MSVACEAAKSATSLDESFVAVVVCQVLGLHCNCGFLFPPTAFVFTQLILSFITFTHPRRPCEGGNSDILLRVFIMNERFLSVAFPQEGKECATRASYT